MVAQNGVIALYQGAAETGRARSAIARSSPTPATPRRASGSTSASNIARRSARWRRWRRWRRRRQYFELLPGASDADYNAYNYMVLTAQSKPQRARENSGGDPCRRHRPHPDRTRRGRSPHLRLSEGARPPHRRRDSVNTSFNVAGPIAQTPQQAIDTLRRSRGLDVVVLVAGDGTVIAAWHGGERDSGRFTGWLADWKARGR